MHRHVHPPATPANPWIGACTHLQVLEAAEVGLHGEVVRIVRVGDQEPGQELLLFVCSHKREVGVQREGVLGVERTEKWDIRRWSV